MITDPSDLIGKEVIYTSVSDTSETLGKGRVIAFTAEPTYVIATEHGQVSWIARAVHEDTREYAVPTRLLEAFTKVDADELDDPEAVNLWRWLKNQGL